jgi:YlmC/YmxH family sporulation protein
MEVDEIFFSELQQKECIDAFNGELLGYIEDAEVLTETGYIQFFVVSPPKKFYHLMQGEKQYKKIYIDDILTIGKDVIIVHRKGG